MKTHLKRPPRLNEVFQSYDPPVYFITFCTMDRRPCLSTDEVHKAFREYGEKGVPRGVAIGRYVIMPDHIHLFVRVGAGNSLGNWAKGLKRALSNAVAERNQAGSVWQPGFFDHLLRTGESYSEKWEYVRLNPVRKGLAASAENWPYQGEIVSIDRVVT